MSSARGPGLSASEIEEFLDSEFPQARALGATLEDVRPERARLRLSAGDEHLRPGGTVSGPTLMALADTAMYLALLGTIGRVPLAVTTSVQMDFLRRPAPGALLASAELIKVGKRLAVGRIEIRSEADHRLVAHASMTYSIPPPGAS